MRLSCYNCDREFEGSAKSDYCSGVCASAAALVRLVRRHGLDAVEADEELESAYCAHLYDVLMDRSYRDRHKVAKAVRESVVERDGGRCVLCGAPGEELDHVAYVEDVRAYNAAANLRLLCRACHRSKAYGEEGPAYFREEVEWTPRQVRRFGEVMARAQAPEPTRRCDDHTHWCPFPGARQFSPDVRRMLEAAGCSQGKVAEWMWRMKERRENQKAARVEGAGRSSEPQPGRGSPG